tara:strand:+ start:20 stop:622 length:603 start_codon:yes stop_codon:yes gene_type:complete
MNTKETKKSKTQHGQGEWVLYRHIRLDTNTPFYVGIGKAKARHTSRHGRNKNWHGIIAKTEWQAEVLFEGLSKEEAATKEKEFIKLYGRRSYEGGLLCNITSGGQCGIGTPQTAEQRLANCLSRENRIPIVIDGIQYPSLKAAGRALGYSSKTIKRRYITGSAHRDHQTPVTVEGVSYPSLNQASINTGLTIYKLKRYHI